MDLVLSLPVADVNRTVDFYRHVLGFEMLGATGKAGVTRARMRLGLAEILFRSAREPQPEAALKPDLQDRVVLHIRVPDVAALYSRVKGRVNLIRDMEVTLFGSGEFAIEDPDGVILAFSQAPAAAARQGAPAEQASAAS